MTDKKPTVGDYLRSGSCVGDSQTNALNCLRQKNLPVFTDIVNDADIESQGDYPLPEDHWINQEIPEEDDKTLLRLALEKNLYDFIDVLLKVGANAKMVNLGRAPIHIAAEGGDSVALNLLFKYKKNQADANAKVKSSGRTALHFLAEKGNTEGVRFLTQQSGIEIDVRDKRQILPLYLAAKHGHKETVRCLIEQGADYNLSYMDKTIKDVIEENISDLDVTKIQRVSKAPLIKQVSKSVLQNLVDIIETADTTASYSEKDLDNFRSLVLEVDSKTLNTFESSGYTLLQKAVNGDLTQFSEILLDDGGVSPNLTIKRTQLAPILMAAQNGCLDTIQILCKYKADLKVVTFDCNDNILHVLLKMGSQEDSEKYKRCVEYLLEDQDLSKDIKAIINKRNNVLNTPLHYASQLWSQDIIRKFLEAGANIGMKNHWDDVPINKILPQTMEDFLDEVCMKTNKDVNHAEFEVTFDYSFLAPLMEDLPYENRDNKVESDPESQNLSSEAEDAVKVALPETLSLWYMGQSEKHRHLLKHPVVTSFLHLKWNRIRRAFNFNLRFYSLFVFVLTWYIFEMFGEKSDVAKEDSTPLIPFWHSLFAIFCVVMLIFILRDWVMDLKQLMKINRLKKESNSEQHEKSFGKILCRKLVSYWIEFIYLGFISIILFGGYQLNILRISLLILTGLLIIREILQLLVSLKRYIISPENWLEVTVICITTVVLITNVDQDLKRHLSAIALVLSWAELITLVGKHPKLTNCNVYVSMFYKIMGTFIFFLCWYAFFIIAFALGFYIMLPKNDDYVFFNEPWLALVKTSTMFVGELEFSDIPIDLDSRFSPLGYIFFLSFVFLIVVVLMNLLNGLAVSDTGIIQEQAEIISYFSRVDTISYTESMLLGDPFNFLSNWPAIKWFSNLPSCSFCVQLYRNASLRKLFHRVTGANGILLFYNYLPDKKLVLKPNKKRPNCEFLQVNIMDESIIESVKKIVLKKRQKSEMDQIEALEKKMEEKMANLEQKLDLLLAKI